MRGGSGDRSEMIRGKLRKLASADGEVQAAEIKLASLARRRPTPQERRWWTWLQLRLPPLIIGEHDARFWSALTELLAVCLTAVCSGVLSLASLAFVPFVMSMDPVTLPQRVVIGVLIGFSIGMLSGSFAQLGVSARRVWRNRP